MFQHPSKRFTMHGTEYRERLLAQVCHFCYCYSHSRSLSKCLVEFSEFSVFPFHPSARPSRRLWAWPSGSHAIRWIPFGRNPIRRFGSETPNRVHFVSSLLRVLFLSGFFARYILSCTTAGVRDINSHGYHNARGEKEAEGSKVHDRMLVTLRQQ